MIKYVNTHIEPKKGHVISLGVVEKVTKNTIYYIPFYGVFCKRNTCSKPFYEAQSIQEYIQFKLKNFKTKVLDALENDLEINLHEDCYI